MEQNIKGVTIRNCATTNNPIAKKNIDTVIEFFSLYLKDSEKFYALWVDDCPEVVTPFTSEDVALCKTAVQSGWPAVKTFFNSVFALNGKFDWLIDEFIVGEDPNTIITRSHSMVDAITGPELGSLHLKYNGVYVQLFRFVDGKVKSFEEYYDTAMLNAQFTQQG